MARTRRRRSVRAGRRASGALVATIDATAGDPGDVAAALLDVLADPAPPARRLVGDGVADLLALAAQPAEVRAAALRQLAR